MNEQTKAQRLADEFENGVVVAHTNQWKEEAAAELRHLDALNAELVEALSLIQPIECDNLHHEKKHRHSHAESCPVKEWIDGVIAKAKEKK